MYPVKMFENYPRPLLFFFLPIYKRTSKTTHTQPTVMLKHQKLEYIHLNFLTDKLLLFENFH